MRLLDIPYAIVLLLVVWFLLMATLGDCDGLVAASDSVTEVR